MAVLDKKDWNAVVEEQWQRYRSGNHDALEEVMSFLLDFSKRVASRTCGTYIHSDDEESGIAHLALWEALQKYEPGRGTILIFIGQVVRNRLIDYKRKQSVRRRFFPVPFSPFLDEAGMPVEVDAIIDEIARRQEIQMLGRALEIYGISFSDLPKASPGQERTRRQALAAAQCLASDIELKKYFEEKKMLPLALLESRYNINRKFMDRYRKYIVAISLIIMGEYTYLKEYLGLEKGGVAGE